MPSSIILSWISQTVQLHFIKLKKIFKLLSVQCIWLSVSNIHLLGLSKSLTTGTIKSALHFAKVGITHINSDFLGNKTSHFVRSIMVSKKETKHEFICVRNYTWSLLLNFKGGKIQSYYLKFHLWFVIPTTTDKICLSVGMLPAEHLHRKISLTFNLENSGICNTTAKTVKQYIMLLLNSVISLFFRL